jgi:glutaredoxin
MTEISQKVILYTTTNCSACDRARAELTAAGAEFEERNVMAKKEWYDEVLKYSISVPVLLRDGKAEVRRGGCLIF